MIQYLRNSEINFQKWDQCIQRSVNQKVYACSWYLNIVSPGWDALVENDYESVFPLTKNRKFGIEYLYQPFFTQQLGVFSDKLLSEEMVDRFLKAIPEKFSFIQINLNSLNKVDPAKYEVEFRSNFELDLIQSYTRLSQQYNQNTSRNLKKAGKNILEVVRKVEPDELISLFMENFGKKEGKLTYRHYETLRMLMDHCIKRNQSSITGIRSQKNSLCAGVFLIYTHDRIIFHFAASGPESRENGAMFLLVDGIIRDHAGKQLILDFEGSSDPDLARFYKGFGANENHYPQVTLNRMPGILANTVNFVKKFRR